MRTAAYSKLRIETEALPGPSAVICMADSVEQLAVIKDQANVIERMDLVFNDAGEAFGLVAPPGEEHARKILEFGERHRRSGTPNLILQCQAGIGRSHAACAAFLKFTGADTRDITKFGTYNRRLYKLILAAAGLPPEREPLVSMVIRVKYSPERLLAFILCMRRQRYENWELIAVTDGPNAGAAHIVDVVKDKRVRLIQTEKSLGRWGHPHRQSGIDAATGEWIGMSNDDNYYVPGYLEQMLMAGENADLVLCRVLHSYCAWDKYTGDEMGNWLARAEIVKRAPWTGVEFTSDRDYLDQLRAAAGPGRVVEVDRALFVHN
jgi:predicted protein tyrosine phosphatase